MESDLQVGELIGYRVYRVRGGYLHGLSNSDWRLDPEGTQAVCTAYNAERTVLRNNPETGLPEAVTVPNHGPIPDPGCGCGHWAYKDEANARHRLRNEMGGGSYARSYARRLSVGGYGHFGDDQSADQGILFVRVKLWGRVVEGTDGYRAEWCKLDAIFSGSRVDQEVVDEVAQRYGVEVIKSAVAPQDPNVVEAEVIPDKISKPVEGRNGRYRPVDVPTRNGDVYKLWPRAKNNRGWSRDYTLLTNATQGQQFELHVRPKQSMYGTDKFIEKVVPIAQAEEFMEAMAEAFDMNDDDLL